MNSLPVPKRMMTKIPISMLAWRKWTQAPRVMLWVTLATTINPCKMIQRNRLLMKPLVTMLMLEEDLAMVEMGMGRLLVTMEMPLTVMMTKTVTKRNRTMVQSSKRNRRRKQMMEMTMNRSRKRLHVRNEVGCVRKPRRHLPKQPGFPDPST